MLLDPNLSLKEVSRISNIDYGVVTSVFNQNTWKHLTVGMTFPSRERGLDDNKVKTIIPRLLNGETDEDIAKDFGLNPKSISYIRLHKTYKHLTKDIDFESRTLVGEDANSSKFKIEDVLEIINLYNSGFTPTQLMEKYNVGRHAIIDILHKKTWSSVTKDLYIRPVEPKIKLTEDDVKTIIKRLKNGTTMQSLADEYHVNNTTIQKIKYGFTWKHIPRD